MSIFKSLYFRMSIIHFAGMIILPLNAFLFTNNIYGEIVQYIIAFLLIFHELDERINGKLLSKKLIDLIKNMDKKNVHFDINTNFASEYKEIQSILEEKEQIKEQKESEENLLIQEAQEVMQHIENGYFSKTILSTTNNTKLEAFKDSVNQMIVQMKNNFNQINNHLVQYTNFNYKDEINIDRFKDNSDLNHFIISINDLKKAIVSMIEENTQNADTLKNITKNLNKNTMSLHNSSLQTNEIVQLSTKNLVSITQQIKDSSDNTKYMENIANEVVNSSKTGLILSKDTQVSMDEINEKVKQINEAIILIDQIAFQTNILSLNAAVEAASAGDSGKGFAIVAQEVRNLANKTTQAAKSIKALVESATNKAEEGIEKSINMSNGYEKLNINIQETLNLINKVKDSSQKEELEIENINNNMQRLNTQVITNTQIIERTQEITEQTVQISQRIEAMNHKKEIA